MVTEQRNSPPATVKHLPSLTTAMARGDDKAFCEFHERYFDRLLGYLLVVTSDEQLARDALQSTLVRVARHVRQFDSEDAFWSWLTVLARSAVVDEQRKASRYGSFLARFFHDQQTDEPERSTDASHDLAQSLETNLCHLSDADRKLVEWKYFERWSVREIAAELQTTEKAVESRLVRIRQQLRQSILADLKHGR